MTISEKEQLLHTIQIIEGNHNIAPTNQPLMERFARLIEKIAEEPVADINFSDRPIDRIYRLFRDNKVSINIAVPPTPPAEDPFAGKSFTYEDGGAFISVVFGEAGEGLYQMQLSEDGETWTPVTAAQPYVVAADGTTTIDLGGETLCTASMSGPDLFVESEDGVFAETFVHDAEPKEIIPVDNPFVGSWSGSVLTDVDEMYIAFVFSDTLWQGQSSPDGESWAANDQASAYSNSGNTASLYDGDIVCTINGLTMHVEEVGSGTSYDLTKDAETKPFLPYTE